MDTHVKLHCNDKYALGALRDLDATRFDGSVRNGTEGKLLGRYAPDNPNFEDWFVVEVSGTNLVEIDPDDRPEVAYVPVHRSAFEEI